MNLVVTAIDEAFKPALIALSNSLWMHGGDVTLSVMVYGSRELGEWALQYADIVAFNPEINAPLPVSKQSHWPMAAQKPMYARILIPKLYNKIERAVWIDADSLVLKDLTPLFEMDLEGRALAAITAPRPLEFHCDGLSGADKKLPVMYSGIYPMDCKEWERQRITEKCLKVMEERTDLHFKRVVQSVLSFVLRGEYAALDSRWQSFGTRPTLPDDPWVVHYHGHNKPWLNHDPKCERNRKLWKKYA